MATTLVLGGPMHGRRVDYVDPFYRCVVYPPVASINFRTLDMPIDLDDPPRPEFEQFGYRRVCVEWREVGPEFYYIPESVSRNVEHSYIKQALEGAAIAQAELEEWKRRHE